jgi:hypothetical protein
MADPIWELKYKGEPVSITLDDLTRQRMREIKAALGEDYGVPNVFRLRLQIGDYEAIAGALWIHGQVTGNPVGDMAALDFCETDFTPADKPKRGPKGSRSSTAAIPGKTGSQSTPTSSETDSSD